MKTNTDDSRNCQRRRGGEMKRVVSELVRRLNAEAVEETKVIPWSCPVPSFGDAARSTVATIGINPSNREFVDDGNRELAGRARRFHTLGSLGLKSWAEAEDPHYDEIASSCQRYFETNPYDRWFKELDFLISGTNFSYYSPLFSACHLDVVPFATSCKWGELTPEHRSRLFAISGDTLGRLVHDSPLQVLILNGSSVVAQFQSVSGTALSSVRQIGWELPRLKGRGVAGYAFHGTISTLAGVKLNRTVTVLGFNHNIQSSFGVTRGVKEAIRSWISKRAREVIA